MIGISAAIRKETGLKGGDPVRVTVSVADSPREEPASRQALADSQQGSARSVVTLDEPPEARSRADILAVRRRFRGRRDPHRLLSTVMVLSFDT